MRILHVFDHSLPLHSGYTFRSRAIVEQQRALGWETFHVTSVKQKNSGSLEETVDGLLFYRTPEPRQLTARLPILNQWSVVTSLQRRLEEIIPQIMPDVIHAHSPALNGLAAVAAGRRFNIPVVYEIRAFWEDAAVDHGTAREWGLRYRVTRALETHVIRRAAAVTTICEGLRQDIIARGVPVQKVTVIPNAVDLDKFSRGGSADQALQASLGLQGRTVLGFLGSFYAYEGLGLLLEALPAILAARPEVRVLLVGGGPQEEHLKRLAQTLGIAAQVVFAGRVPHDQVPRYYDLVDILVYPRLSMRLTELVTPLKPLEAMAQGRLLVASDVGGHRELIRHGETGWLFRAGDAADLAASILQLLSDQARWPVIWDAARRFVEQERNWAASVGRYQGVYQGLLANTPERNHEQR